MTAGDNEVRTFTVTNCTNCGSSDVRQWCVTYDRLYRTSKQQFEYKKCNNCHSLFLSTGPVEENVYKFYPSNYGPYFAYDTNPGKEKGDSFLKQLTYAGSKIWNKLFRLIDDNSLQAYLDKFYKGDKQAFLDFGCGSELFLNLMREQGWNGVGMDFSPQAILQVEKHGHKGILYDSENAWDKVADGSIDVIRMNHVIEHLYKPKHVLRVLNKKLRKDGRIHISTPNAGSITSSIYKKFWLGIDCPRHIVIYSPYALKKILEDSGFGNVRIFHETVTKDIARSIGFKQEDKGEIAHSEIGAKVNDKKLQSILYGPAVLLNVLKRSDRIHAFATK